MKVCSRFIRLISATVVFLCVAATTSHAFFERIVASSRSEALGGSFVAVADDATATWFNAAGLTSLSHYQLMATYVRPYAVGDVGQGYTVAAVPTSIGVFGASWFYRGLRDVMSENLLSVSYARDLLRTAEDASLSVGATLDYARVSVTDRFNASDDAFTVGLSAHMRPFPMIGVGYAVRNLNESDLHLVDGGLGTTLKRQQSWGLSYFWAQRLILSYERRQDTRGVWRNHGGIELKLGGHVELRSGLDGRYATMGMGVNWSGIMFDVGLSSHESLGATYIFSIGYGPPKPVNPFAQMP